MVVLCFRIQRNAWFSVVHAMRQSRSLRRLAVFLSLSAGPPLGLHHGRHGPA